MRLRKSILRDDNCRRTRALRLFREDPFPCSPTWTRTKTKGSKDPCAAITPWGNGGISLGKHRQVFIMPYHANPACREVMPQFQQRLPQAHGPTDMVAGSTGLRRTGNPARGVPDTCRTARRPNRPRTRHEWRWPAAARWTGPSGHPNASPPESARYR